MEQEKRSDEVKRKRIKLCRCFRSKPYHILSIHLLFTRSDTTNDNGENEEEFVELFLDTTHRTRLILHHVRLFILFVAMSIDFHFHVTSILCYFSCHMRVYERTKKKKLCRKYAVVPIQLQNISILLFSLAFIAIRIHYAFQAGKNEDQRKKKWITHSDWESIASLAFKHTHTNAKRNRFEWIFRFVLFLIRFRFSSMTSNKKKQEKQGSNRNSTLVDIWIGIST